METLLTIYGRPIVASGLMGACLAVMGAHIAAKDRAMQTLCLSQGALLGVLLGIGLLSGLAHQGDPGLLGPFAGAGLGALLAWVLGEILVRHAIASKNTYFAALFALLMAAGSLVIALFPGLESHHSQRFFGDLAVITDRASEVAILLAVVMGGVLIRTSKAMTRATFFEESLGIPAPPHGGLGRVLILAMMLGGIAFSTQVMGLLFTITALFVPTSVLRPMSGGYRAHLVACALTAGSASILGFVLSLTVVPWPTAPLVAMCMGGISLVTAVLHRVLSGRGWKTL